MSRNKYVGLDVHQASISIAVLDDRGRLVVQATIKTTSDAIRDFIGGLSGTVLVTLEEGTQAGWLYEVIKPLVAEVVVCDPRQNSLLKAGNKGDRIDANKLAQLLRGGLLNGVYHGNQQTKTLRHLARNYDCIVGDTTRVMNRIKALSEARGLPARAGMFTTGGTVISG